MCGFGAAIGRRGGAPPGRGDPSVASGAWTSAKPAAAGGATAAAGGGTGGEAEAGSAAFVPVDGAPWAWGGTAFAADLGGAALAGLGAGDGDALAGDSATGAGAGFEAGVFCTAGLAAVAGACRAAAFAEP